MSGGAFVSPMGHGMNGYDYDRGPGANGMDSYREDSYREDMRREEEERYRRAARNGGPFHDRFNTDILDQTSLSDFRSNDPKFEMDHLATFAAGTRNGTINTEEGLRKLRQMENTTGIWTMRCMLIVERQDLVILDNSTGEEIERFPIGLVQDPSAVFKSDRHEIYTNLVLFTIVDDPKKKPSQADMHIFQSVKAPAQTIVDEIIAAKRGQQRLGTKVPPPPAVPAPEPPSGAYNFQGMRDFFDNGQAGPGLPGHQRLSRISNVREREDIDGGSAEMMQKDVQLLNHCFDDIEKFVSRLQQAAESFKELEKRKRERGAKNRKRQTGDGMLYARARPPPDRDFVDIFQKFKLSFNLLAKLKANIHDPNAPELVHFLFTPLSLIYEASRDPHHGNQNLGDQAVVPVLTVEAKQLLLNCLSSKEVELWQHLGKHWTTSKAEWVGHIPAYVPQFYDGWQPAAGVIDDFTSRQATLPQPSIMDPKHDDRVEFYHGYSAKPMPFPDDDRPPMGADRYRNYNRSNDDFDRLETNFSGFEPIQPVLRHDPNLLLDVPPKVPDSRPPQRGFDPPISQSFDFQSLHDVDRTVNRGWADPQASSAGFAALRKELNERQAVDRNMHNDFANDSVANSVPAPAVPVDDNTKYLRELLADDALIYSAVHDRKGKNEKELSVQKGDILQVLENSKNWWRLRNYKGQVGYAPYTILKEVRSEDDYSKIRSVYPNRGANDDGGVKRGANRRGEFKYF